MITKGWKDESIDIEKNAMERSLKACNHISHI
jgi:hypothetical protein